MYGDFLEIEPDEDSVDETFRSFMIYGGINYDDLNAFLDEAKVLVVNQVEGDDEPCVKVYILVQTLMTRNSNGIIIETTPYFKSKTATVYRSTDFNEVYEQMRNKITESFNNYTCGGSGWTLSYVEKLYLRIDKCDSITGSSYIDLPRELKLKHAIINVENKDQKCFMYSVLSCLHSNEIQRHPQRPAKYTPYLNELNFEGIDFPVLIKDISKFERQNNLKINVFGYENGLVHVLRLNDDNPQEAIDLLYITKDGNNHYCWIKNFSALVSSQTTRAKKLYFCKRCLNGFRTEEKMLLHTESCEKNSSCKVELPDEGTKLKFENEYKSEKVPYIIYADFESLIKRMDTVRGGSGGYSRYS